MLQELASVARPNRVQVFDPAAVTTVAEDEQPARAGGLMQAQVDEIWGAVSRYYETGLHPAMNLCIRRHGAKVLDRAIGHTHGNVPGNLDESTLRQSTPESLFNLFSASKSVTAMLIHHLDDAGEIHIDDRVAEYIPEFAANGKEKTTIRHVLNHRAGLPLVPADKFDLDLLTDEKGIVAYLCEARPSTVPGRKLAYHALTGGFILAEIIRRVSGKPIRQYLDEVVRQPMGMKSFQYGVTPEQVDEVADDVFTGPKPPFPLSALVKRAFGADMPTAVRLANDPLFRTGVVPSGNIYCTAEEASRFFEVLLRGGVTESGDRIFSERSIQRARIEQSYHEHDAVLQYPFRFGLGFMLGSDRSSVLGPDTPEAFGHMGFTNIILYADPERDISIALLNNGKPLIAVESLWWLNIARTITRVIPKVT